MNFLNYLRLFFPINSGAGDVKQQYSRADGGMSNANTGINAPPGLGPATANNAEQAAQLMPQAAAAAYQYSLINPMQSPYLPPFVVSWL